jgi:List-Bact-rpt repeat protein
MARPVAAPTSNNREVIRLAEGSDTVVHVAASYNSGTIVTLTAVPDAGSTFAGWSSTGCSSGSITMTSSTTCTADFQIATTSLATKIGVFRPSTGEWFLDRSGTGQWDGIITRQTSDGEGNRGITMRPLAALVAKELLKNLININIKLTNRAPPSALARIAISARTQSIKSAVFVSQAYNSTFSDVNGYLFNFARHSRRSRSRDFCP